jgi:rubrerythrin
MSITFNADEIFEMAEEIERNGAKYYREAAEKASEKETKQMLLDMATMEDGHLQTFQAEKRNRWFSTPIIKPQCTCRQWPMPAVWKVG